MPHVQHAGDVGRRDDDGVAAAAALCSSAANRPVLFPEARTSGVRRRGARSPCPAGWSLMRMTLSSVFTGSRRLGPPRGRTRMVKHKYRRSRRPLGWRRAIGPFL
ncbi:MAG: hypothetical protein MZV70_49300 [Desulfobacterales bacterium]|nr:hypothetical protein [Desulfobacterales bacterium]